MRKIEGIIGEPAHRIAAELEVPVGRITLGESIGPSDQDGAANRWPLFVNGRPSGRLWDTAIGFALADADTIVSEHGADIIIVDDGAYRWGADREELLDYLSDAGWTVAGWKVREPAFDGAAGAPDAPYARLCHHIQPPSGWEASARTKAWDSLPSLRLSEQDGRGVWMLNLTGE